MTINNRKKIIDYNNSNSNNNDIVLISQSLKGNREALSILIMRYKDWIFNLAIRMFNNPDDAEDVTQEILIKIITHLKNYDQVKASFKTWIYRIAINHMINMKKSSVEKYNFSFNNYYERMDYIEDREPVYTPEINALIQDTMINCVMATLICLDRIQRLVIILGVIFNINSKIGSEIMGITSVNFRKILSRSRKKLKKFMSTTCSLVNKNAKCRCHMKITELINLGYRNPEELIYAKLKHDKLVRDVVNNKVTKFMNKYFYKFNDLFQSQPFWETFKKKEWLDRVINNKDFRDIFYLD